MFEFLPSKKIRSFNCNKFKGEEVTIELRQLGKLRELNDKKTLQWISCRIPEFELYFSGWVQKLGKPDTKIVKKIKKAYIMEHDNGGRSDTTQYSSYKSYFNSEKKKEVLSFWSGGLLSRIASGGGDKDSVDVILEFDNFEINSNRSFDAPEEWYSELHGSKNTFKFVDGFYKTANEAIEKFSQKSSDDLFGTRYFPLIVFQKQTKADVRSIAEKPKACSRPIVTTKYIIYGTRCKSYEYPDVIKATYKAGGSVPIGCQWDWS